MAISERAGEAVANVVLPGIGNVAKGEYDNAMAQAGINALGLEDSALAQIISNTASPLVSKVRRAVVDTVTQTGDNTVTASDVAEADGNVNKAMNKRLTDRFQEEYVAQPIYENTDKKASELTEATFQQLGYSKEQAAQMVNDTAIGGFVKGAYTAGLRPYDQVASEAANQLLDRADVSTNTNVPKRGGGPGINPGGAALTAETLHEDMQRRAIEDRAFAGMTGEDVNQLTAERIHSGKYDRSKNDIQRGHNISADVASDAAAVRDLKEVYGRDASAQQVMQHTTALRGSDIRNMSDSRKAALTAETARIARNTGMTEADLTVAAGSGATAAAERGLNREAGYRIGLSAQKQMGSGGIRVEGLSEDQYRAEISSVMADEAAKGTVTDSAAAYRAYLDATGSKDTDETFSKWQADTENIDFSDSAQTQEYIAKTMGVSGSKAADAYDAYSRSKDTQRMAESRDFYSSALQGKVNEINKTVKAEQRDALKGAGIKLDKVFKDDVEYNSMTQQERKDKIREYAKAEGKDMVEVEAALTRSDRLFETTAEYHGMSAEAADQAIVSSRKNRDMADKKTPQQDNYSKGMEGLSQVVSENQRSGKETSISDIATVLTTGTSKDSLKTASDYIEDSLMTAERNLPNAGDMTMSSAMDKSKESSKSDMFTMSEGRNGETFRSTMDGTVSVSAQQAAGGGAGESDGGLSALLSRSESIIKASGDKDTAEATTSALSSIVELLNQIKNKIG